MLFFIKFETNVSIKKKKVQFSLIGNNYHFKTKKKKMKKMKIKPPSLKLLAKTKDSIHFLLKKKNNEKKEDLNFIS